MTKVRLTCALGIQPPPRSAGVEDPAPGSVFAMLALGPSRVASQGTISGGNLILQCWCVTDAALQFFI